MQRSLANDCTVAVRSQWLLTPSQQWASRRVRILNAESFDSAQLLAADNRVWRFVEEALGAASTRPQQLAADNSSFRCPETEPWWRSLREGSGGL